MTREVIGNEISVHSTGHSIACTRLLPMEWLRHASTTRSFSSPESIRRDELLKARDHLGETSTLLVHGEQKHTANVGVVTQEIIDSHRESAYCRFMETDALVCSYPNVTLAIMTADCAPIFLVDPVSKIVALVHAGWRGTLARIANEAIGAMHNLGSNPSDIVAWLGPMACCCCYEVDKDLVQKFQSEFPGWSVTAQDNDRHLDLVSINRQQLVAGGLSESNIVSSNICSIHQNEHFYSYRADAGTTGRIISVIGMTF